jgi:hypothetical protein
MPHRSESESGSRAPDHRKSDEQLKSLPQPDDRLGLVLCAPRWGPDCRVNGSRDAPRVTAAGGAAFAYLGVVSMFLGFFAWYRRLAIGPMAQVSQVQLVQPVGSIALAGLQVGEHLTWATIS